MSSSGPVWQPHLISFIIGLFGQLRLASAHWGDSETLGEWQSYNEDNITLMTGCHCLSQGVNYHNKVHRSHTPRHGLARRGRGWRGARLWGVSSRMGRAAVWSSLVWPVMICLYIHCILQLQYIWTLWLHQLLYFLKLILCFRTLRERNILDQD